MPATEEAPPADIPTSQEASADYRRLAIEAAEGNPPSMDTIRTTCFACGRTYADFQRCVAALQTRKRAFGDLAEAETLKAELAEVRNALHAEQAKVKELFERQQRELEEACQPGRELEARRDELMQRQRRLGASANTTIRRTTDPAIAGEVEEISRRIGELERQRDGVLELVRGRRDDSLSSGPGPQRNRMWLENRIDELSASLERRPSDKDQTELSRCRDELDRIARHEATVARLDDEIGTQHAAMRALDDRRRDWRNIDWQ